MTPVTLVTGNSAGVREAAIAAMVMASSLSQNAAVTNAEVTNVALTTAIILEGMPDGTDPFAAIAANSALSIIRIAPGCPCCIGNLTMRVTLNRILRHPPHKLYISLATHAHLDRIREFITNAPYDKLLVLTKDIHV